MCRAGFPIPHDLKSAGGNTVRVRPPPALLFCVNLLFASLPSRNREPSDIRGLSCYLEIPADLGWRAGLKLLRTRPECPADLLHIWSQVVVAEEQRAMVARSEPTGEVDGGDGPAAPRFWFEIAQMCISMRLYRDAGPVLCSCTAIPLCLTQKRSRGWGQRQFRRPKAGGESRIAQGPGALHRTVGKSSPGSSGS